MPQMDYASKGPLQTPMPKGDVPQKKYALKGLCLKKLCPKGTKAPKIMPFYCTTGSAYDPA